MTTGSEDANMKGMAIPDLTRMERDTVHGWLCRHLEAARERAGGVQQRHLAAETGVNESTISSIERRGRALEPMPKKPPHARTCMALERWAKKVLGYGAAGCAAAPCPLCAVKVAAPEPPPSRHVRPKTHR